MKNLTVPVIISLIIILSSYIITNYLNKQYSFAKLSGFLLFYYAIIILFSWLSVKYFKSTKMIGSIVGFVLSVLLWFMFKDYALNN